MNEIMMSYDLAKTFQELADRNIPTVERTIASVNGNVITTQETGAGDASDLFWAGQVHFLDGSCAHMRTAVVQSAANQLIVSGAFTGRFAPEAGDTIRLSGGPLSEAKIFMFEPESVLHQGNFLVTVNAYNTRMKRRSLGTLIKGFFNHSRSFDFEVVCEAPKYVGGASDIASLSQMLFDLKILKEQCELIVLNYRAQEESRITGEGDIETTYGMIQRTGSDFYRHSAHLEFTIRQT